MTSLIFIAPVALIIIVSTIVVRWATIILKLTGMEENKARFQALSAFTGTGFTTRDSEDIVKDQRRRRVIMTLMILGNAGIVSVIATFVLTFIRGGTSDSLIKLALFMVLLLLFYRFLTSRQLMAWLDRKLQKRIEQKGVLKKKSMETLYHLPKGYGITELKMDKGFEEIGMTLNEAGFRDKDIMVLSIEKKDRIISSPKAYDKIDKGDIILCYGPLSKIKEYLPEKVRKHE